MANEIKSKTSAPTSLTITLASLATDAGGKVGRQSTMVDNSTNQYQVVRVFLRVKLGTSPTGSRAVYVYAIHSDDDATTPLRSDAAGASDAALTVKSAKLIGVLPTGASPSTGDNLEGEFEIIEPGDEWGIAVAHDTGVNLDSTEGNHIKRFVGILPEIQ